MKYLPSLLKTAVMIALATGWQTLSLAAGTGPQLYYPLDEGKGTIVHDAGTLHHDGALSTEAKGEITGATLAFADADVWIPLLGTDGIQHKNIVAASEHLLADGEAPIVVDRDRDYSMDNINGLIKALPGGKIANGQQFSVDYKYTNSGPQWVTGKLGGGLSLDGHDNYVKLGKLSGAMPQITLQLWLYLPAKCNDDAVILGNYSTDQREPLFALRLQHGALQFFHPSLKTATGAVVPTQAAASLKHDDWNLLVATCDGTACSLYVNGKQVAQQAGLTGALNASGDFYVGGIHDPQFLAGTVDEIKIYNRALSADEIAKAMP